MFAAWAMCARPGDRCRCKIMCARGGGPNVSAAAAGQERAVSGLRWGRGRVRGGGAREHVPACVYTAVPYSAEASTALCGTAVYTMAHHVRHVHHARARSCRWKCARVGGVEVRTSSFAAATTSSESSPGTAPGVDQHAESGLSRALGG